MKKFILVDEPFVVIDFDRFEDVDLFAKEIIIEIKNIIYYYQLDYYGTWIINIFKANKSFVNIIISKEDINNINIIIYDKIIDLYYVLQKIEDKEWKDSVIIKPKKKRKPIYIDVSYYRTIKVSSLFNYFNM